jgi:hypothetical protein
MDPADPLFLAYPDAYPFGVDRKKEAFDRLDGRFDTRVLEPSPPPVDEPPWLADDPIDSPAAEGNPVVAPVPGFDHTWDELCSTEPDLAAWCADRWLGGWQRLSDLPDRLGSTRRSLHTLAEHVVTPARYHTNGKIGLRYTHRGFGTPFFGDTRQVRVEGSDLVVDRGASEERAPITTLAAAAEFVNVEPGGPNDLYPCTTPRDTTALLPVDDSAASCIADWFGFAASVLEELRTEAAIEEMPSRVQLWPEHFDIALELGAESAAKRAGYGASPGDEAHNEPYLYVVPWVLVTDEAWWNDTHYKGARLDYKEILESDDQRRFALDFFRKLRNRLRSY